VRRGSRILRGFEGEKARGSALFGVGVRALQGTMANHNHRHFARAAGIRPPAEPPALLACPVHGGREPGLGKDGSRLFYCALGEEALCAKEGRDRGLGSGGCCRKNSTLINSVLLLKFAGLRGVVSHSRSVRRCASRRCSLEQSG
jgi:hypothetical protein